MTIFYNNNEMDYSFNDIVLPIHFTKKQPITISGALGDITVKAYENNVVKKSLTISVVSYDTTLDLCILSCFLTGVSADKTYGFQRIEIMDAEDTYNVSVINQNADTYDLSSRSYTVKTNRDYDYCYLGGERGIGRDVVLYFKDGTSTSVVTTNGDANPIYIGNVTKMVIGGTISINYEEVCSGITVRWSDLFGNIMHYTFESFKIQEQFSRMASSNSISETLIQVDDIAFGDNVEMLNFICRASEIEVYNSNRYVWRKAECTNKAGAVFNNSDQGTRISITLSCNLWN